MSHIFLGKAPGPNKYDLRQAAGQNAPKTNMTSRRKLTYPDCKNYFSSELIMPIITWNIQFFIISNAIVKNCYHHAIYFSLNIYTLDFIHNCNVSKPAYIICINYIRQHKSLAHIAISLKLVTIDILMSYEIVR